MRLECRRACEICVREAIRVEADDDDDDDDKDEL